MSLPQPFTTNCSFMTDNNLSGQSVAGLETVDAFLLDLDGVLHRGEERLPGAVEFIDALNSTQTPFLVLTNNATRTPEQVAGKLNGMGVRVGSNQVFSSAQATARWLRMRFAAGSRVLVIGEGGILTALEEAGYQIVSDHRETDVVVTALDRTITYERLAEAALAINSGCPFVATNPDASIPTERGIEPGAGAIQAFLQTSTGVVPTVIGKPQTEVFRLALESLGTDVSGAVMVGDRYGTDILGGYRAGLRTAAVLTGISTAEELATADPAPTWVFGDLAGLLAAWSNARGF